VLAGQRRDRRGGVAQELLGEVGVGVGRGEHRGRGDLVPREQPVGERGSDGREGLQRLGRLVPSTPAPITVPPS
jgi:hypothetical protein